MSPRGWIGVDLDGTLAYYAGWQGTEHVGEPIKLMCDRVRSWLSQGQEVRIFTARVYGMTGDKLIEVLEPINAFCEREFGKALPVTCTKDFGMIALWDDRAVQVIPNTGVRADGG